jgi:O-antigen ligase
LICSIVIAALFVAISSFAFQPYPEAPFSCQIPGTGVILMPSSRFLVWREALQTFIQNPIFGYGLGLPVASVMFTNTDGSKSLLTDAHNTFLSVAAQNGVFGLIAIVLIVGSAVRKWLRAVVNKNKWIVTRGLGLAFICSFVYQGLTGSFEEARHLWVLLGLFLSAESQEEN